MGVAIRHKNACLLIGALGFATPLLFIAVSIALSPWFSFVDNALSDLGHATDSDVAPLFNFGLALGGFLISTYAACFVVKLHRGMGLSLYFAGFSLALIGVFDEVYNRFWRMHFWIAMAFFASFVAYLTLYAKRKKTLLPLLAIAAEVLSWALHIAYDIPEGAAIPELVSIVAVLPFYASHLLEVAEAQERT